MCSTVVINQIWNHLLNETPMTAKTVLLLSESDNVVVVLTNISKGEDLPATRITARETIPRGHKLSLIHI